MAVRLATDDATSLLQDELVLADWPRPVPVVPLMHEAMQAARLACLIPFPFPLAVCPHLSQSTNYSPRRAVPLSPTPPLRRSSSRRALASRALPRLLSRMCSQPLGSRLLIDLGVSFLNRLRSAWALRVAACR